MKNELKKIKDKYFNGNTHYGYFSKRLARFLLKAIKDAKETDAPDFYYLTDKTCYIFEHFEFDASQMSKNKGSFFKRQEKKSDKEIDLKSKERLSSKVPNQKEITNYGVISSSITSNYKKEFWQNNFIITFSKHYNKIEQYKNNLLNDGIISKNIKIKTIFVIEDTTEFGANYFDNNECVCLPCDFDFCVDLLMKSKKVDYFIFLNKASKFIFIVNKSALKYMKKHCLNFDNTKIFFFNDIQVVSSLLTIPNKFE